MNRDPLLARSRPRAATAILLAALALAGCASGSRPGGVAPASGAGANQSSAWQGRVRDAIAALNRGDSAGARRQLMATLRRQPGDTVARQLLAQIDTDPRVLLGTENYSYTMREGETLSTVAGRALGNPMMFYALARYNNIAVPSSVVPGQTILVPGRRPAPPAQPRPQPRPTPSQPSQPSQPSHPTPTPTPVVPAPQPGPAANPALAARLRGQGLAAMNAGAIDRAVSLLSRAAALDPGNAAIRADLARARRVQSTVRSRR